MQSFNEWAEAKEHRSVIYLDFDQTLVDQTTGFEPHLRPGAKSFIAKLQKLAPVCILTHGATYHQTSVARELGIDLKVIGRDEYHLVDAPDNAVLVDDCPKDDFKTKGKLHAIGIGPERLVHIEPWYEGQKDTELERVYKKVKELLDTKTKNEWVEKSPQTLPKRQPFKSYVKAKDLAKEREDKFHDLLKEAAGKYKVIHDIKTKDAFDNKTGIRGKDPDKVFDVLRGSILVDSKAQIPAVIESIKQVFLVKKIDHKTKPDKEFGYYGSVHVDVVVNDMICEVQVLTKKLWDHKLEGWEMYRKYRGKKVPPEIVEKSKALYRKANGD
jgi:hypothetical protein